MHNISLKLGQGNDNIIDNIHPFDYTVLNVLAYVIVLYFSGAMV